ncbi:MAG: hypothetical protein HC824_09435 [Synechococcales cyanobacterium RM1_1_8]|nr:hypothetical protein [Synechococcales cyanobacterium RM1_1_8]
MVNTSGDYVLFINRANQIIHGNGAACAALGYAPADLTALSIEFLDTHLAPEDWQTIWDHLQHHASLNLRSSHRHQSGRALDVSLEFKYITLHGQDYSCIIAMQH